MIHQLLSFLDQLANFLKQLVVLSMQFGRRFAQTRRFGNGVFKIPVSILQGKMQS